MFKAGLLHGFVVGLLLSATVFVLVSIFAAWAWHP